MTDPMGGGPEKVWQLRLYVAGTTPKSVTAFANLRKICEEHLTGRYMIEVIDLLENPQLARGDQIFAIPTLVRKLPEPIRKIIGALSNTERVLVGLICARAVEPDEVNVVPKEDKTSTGRDVQAEFEEALRKDNRASYVLRLYIAGMSPRSVAALENLQSICEAHLAGRYTLEVVDVLQEPARAREANLVVAPTLIKELPVPVRRFLGDMSNTEKVLIGLDLVKRGS